MYRKTLLSAALLTAFTAPAFAATFYVEQYVADKDCRVVTTKPDGNKVTMVGDASYTTKADAEAALKAAAACKKQ
jgi:hypothetical protein